MFRQTAVIIDRLFMLKAAKSYSIVIPFGPIIHTRFRPPSFSQRSDALSSSLIFSFVIAKAFFVPVRKGLTTVWS